MRFISRFLLLSIVVSLMGTPETSKRQVDPFLDRQRAALRPEFQADLVGLTQAPRYTILAALDQEAGEVQGTVSVVYTHRGNQPAPDLIFRLPASSTAIYGGGETTVSRVQIGGKPSRSIYDPSLNTFRVPLAEPVLPGQSVTAWLEFITRLPESTATGYGILGRARRVISLAGWYPILAVHDEDWQIPALPSVGDGMFAETSLYELDIELPAGWQLAASGIETVGETRNGRSTWKVISGPARELALAISPRFIQTSAPGDTVRIRYFSLPAESAKNSPQDGLDAGRSFLTAYEARYGPYPWSELDIVDSSISIGGFEFPGMVFIDYGLRVRGSRADFRWIVAHEIAHQWWYGLVGSDQIRNPWLDEALATYAPLVGYEDLEGSDAAARMLRTYRSRANEAGNGQPHFSASSSEFDTWRSYNRAVYYRGAMFLDALRNELGAVTFAQLLWTYSGRYRYQIAKPEDFLALAEELTGRNLTGFYRRWGLRN